MCLPKKKIKKRCHEPFQTLILLPVCVGTAGDCGAPPEAEHVHLAQRGHEGGQRGATQGPEHHSGLDALPGVFQRLLQVCSLCLVCCVVPDKYLSLLTTQVLMHYLESSKDYYKCVVCVWSAVLFLIGICHR